MALTANEIKRASEFVILSTFTQHSLKIHSFQQSRTMPILQQCSTMLTFKFEFKFKFRFKKKKKSSSRRTCLTLLCWWPVDGQWLFDQRSSGSEFEREFGRGIWKWSWKSRKNTLRFLCFRSTLLRQCHYCSMNGVQQLTVSTWYLVDRKVICKMHFAAHALKSSAP